MLDDVYHFLEENFLIGNHNTVRDPPTAEEIRASLGELHDPIKNHSQLTDGINGSTKQRTNGITNGNGINGDAAAQSNGYVHTNGGQSNGNGTATPSPHPRLLLISSFDEKGTARVANSLSSHFSSLSLPPSLQPTYVRNLTNTLNHRRSLLPFKSFSVVQSFASLTELPSLISPAVRTTTHSHPVSLGMIFTGQGAQYPAMGAALLCYPPFAASLSRSRSYLRTLGCPWDLLDELLAQAPVSRINSPEFSQPLCTAVQLALVDLLRSFGILPAAVVGHSSGEITAAYAIGAISAEDAMGVAYYRGVCAAKLAESSNGQGGRKGGMIAVGLSATAAREYIDQVAAECEGERGLTVACVNSPKNVTISGYIDQINLLKALLDRESVFARKLMVDVAYHSPHMNAVADEYRRLLEGMRISNPPDKDGGAKAAVMVSSVTGKRIPPNELTNPDYWVSNLVSPVQFTAAVNHLFSATQRGAIRKKLDLSHKKHLHVDNLLEVGPHAALQGPIRDILTGLPGIAKRNIGYSSALVRKQDASVSLMEAMGRLCCAGHPVDLRRINEPSYNPESTERPKEKTLTDLPGYPFDHSEGRRYWLERRLGRAYRTHKQNKWDLLGKPVSDWNPLEAKWRNVLRVGEMPWVEDHVVRSPLASPIFSHACARTPPHPGLMHKMRGKGKRGKVNKSP